MENASTIWALGGVVCLTAALALGLATLVWEWIKPRNSKEI